ncbi:anti-sigma factor [Mycolicibacter arupensis]|jgi:anti-sigma regulatory factor (Ser/Thr protein kinase)|uniref:Anti-sigma factor n=1 Tax=Mycolicibacter arupensis TaxID=342002 RepID=A0A0F5MZB0_9MYCO|nr:anti-sigma factor [Mycolicibacter arupensis]KKC00149.1 anti-sigma factor [Mycolicibacter arupensis]MCV7276093.1 anti-sigma factor [Mycolicibacter arupensis]ORA01172.1 anti-sigma factor [Mycolicibacter arupensis]TXI58984.1 MAG: anti-sigma factor [Mycolicibacter arupensis]
MTDIDSDRARRACSERAVELRVTPRLESLAVIRMLVGAVATYEDLDVDTVADLRLAIDELCTQLIRSAAPGAMLTVVVDPNDEYVTVQASAPGTAAGVLVPGSFSWHVLTALVDEVEAFREGPETDGAGEVFGVTLTTRRADSGR